MFVSWRRARLAITKSVPRKVRFLPDSAYTIQTMRARAAVRLSSPLLLAAGFVVHPLWAVELPNARLSVSRTAGAESCPDESAIAREIERRSAGLEAKSREPLSLDVVLTQEGDAFVATIAVDGRLKGQRTLRSESPTCDALRDALILSIQVLLDQTPVPELPPPTPRERRHEPALFAYLGGALTHGQPRGFSAAIEGGAALDVGKWEVGTGIVWAPAQSVDSGPGAVEVQAWGMQSDVCRFVTTFRRVRVSACALASLRVLRGKGRGLDEERTQIRPWWLAGAGAQAVLPVAARLEIGVFVNGFLTLHPDTFSVEGLGEQYRTDVITFSTGLDLRMRLF
jgi:hypothetical protein